jgi:hypothetical protein
LTWCILSISSSVSHFLVSIFQLYYTCILVSMFVISFAVTGSQARSLGVGVIGWSGKPHTLPLDILISQSWKARTIGFIIHAELKVCAHYASLPLPAVHFGGAGTIIVRYLCETIF